MHCHDKRTFWEKKEKGKDVNTISFSVDMICKVHFSLHLISVPIRIEKNVNVDPMIQMYQTSGILLC